MGFWKTKVIFFTKRKSLNLFYGSCDSCFGIWFVIPALDLVRRGSCFRFGSLFLFQIWFVVPVLYLVRGFCFRFGSWFLFQTEFMVTVLDLVLGSCFRFGSLFLFQIWFVVPVLDQVLGFYFKFEALNNNNWLLSLHPSPHQETYTKNSA